jgi:hypothetical protein
MAIGRISGPMLKANLERLGVDLAFETELLYLDVANGRIGIKNSSPSVELDVTGSARISSNLTAQGISTLGNLRLSNNTVTSTNANGDIVLTPNGTGKVLIGTSSSAGDYLLQIAGNVYATGNIVAQGNIQLGDADTDTISFGGEVTSDIYPDLDASYRLGKSTKRWIGYFNSLDVGNISIAGSSILTTATNEDLVLDANGTGAVVVNARLGVNTATPVSSVHINATDAVVLPAGTNSERPTGEPGMIRFNTDLNKFEVFDSYIWRTLADSSGAALPITSQSFVGDGSTTDFYVADGITQDSVIVSINGTVQRPSAAYTVSAGTMSFTEPPFASDVIEVRIIGQRGDTTSTPSVNKITYENLTTTPTKIDSWPKSTFRAAEYSVSASDGSGKHQFSKISLLHDDTTVYQSEYGVIAPNGSVVTITTTVTSTRIEIYATAASGSTTNITAVRTLFEI